MSTSPRCGAGSAGRDVGSASPGSWRPCESRRCLQLADGLRVELGNLAHALGKLEAFGDAWSSLWEAVALASLRRCTVFNAQNLANTAWAYAKSGHAGSLLLDAIAAEAARSVRDFNPQGLANTAWA